MYKFYTTCILRNFLGVNSVPTIYYYLKQSQIYTNSALSIKPKSNAVLILYQPKSTVLV